MVRKKEQFRMKELLTEAITVLCKASLAYRKEFSIEGLLGITLDNEEIFLVNINEHVKKEQDANNPVPTHTSRSPSPPSPPSYQRKSPSPRQRLHDRGRTSPSSLRQKRRRLDVKNESSSNPIIIKEEDDDDDHWYGSGSARIPTPQDAVESGMGIMTSPRLQSDGRGVDALTKMVDSVTGESSEMPYVVNQVPSIDAAPGDDVDKGGGGGEEDFGSHLNLSAENSLQNALPGCSSWDSFQQPAQDTDQKKIGDLKLPLNEVSSDRTLVKVERLDPEVNDNVNRRISAAVTSSKSQSTSSAQPQPPTMSMIGDSNVLNPAYWGVDAQTADGHPMAVLRPNKKGCQDSMVLETADGLKVVVPAVNSAVPGLSQEAVLDYFLPTQSRGSKIDLQAFNNVPVKKVDRLPFDIDGICIYELPFEVSRRMASSRDGRNWGSAISSNRKGFPKGRRKIARCRGSNKCPNEWCSYRRNHDCANQLEFIEKTGETARCRYCNSISEYVACPASKIWEFHDDFLRVQHYGVHTCKAHHL